MSKKNDITAKITTLIIAIFLWSFVMSEVNPDWPKEYKNVPVSLNNISTLDRQGLVIMEPQDVTVNVKVVGKKSDMFKFYASNITAQVDLSGYKEGQVKIPVTASLIGQTSGMKIVDIEPKEILFTIDRVVTKKMPVTLMASGTLPDNYVLGTLETTSQTVLLKGPRTWVNEVNKVMAVVDLTSRTTTDTVLVPITIVDDKGNDVRGIEKEPNTVDVNIPIYRTVSLPIELQTENKLPENFSITDIQITPSNITVKGDKNIVDLQKIDTKDIDINSLLDKSALEVELDLPEGVELLNPEQKITVIYNVEETITKEFVFTVGELKLLNLDQNLKVSEEDLNTLVKVTLTGFKSILEKMGNNDLDISINLNQLARGSNTVAIMVPKIQGATVKDIDPQPLTLNLNTR